ncbi:MAG: hypothetical protein IID33_03600 [Planctomycetes bacterium]|nr:hypothetical protein [Planctomycetota bacterium]
MLAELSWIGVPDPQQQLVHPREVFSGESDQVLSLSVLDWTVILPRRAEIVTGTEAVAALGSLAAALGSAAVVGGALVTAVGMITSLTLIARAALRGALPVRPCGATLPGGGALDPATSGAQYEHHPEEGSITVFQKVHAITRIVPICRRRVARPV